MKKIIISIALLLSTAAHAAEIPVASDVSGVPSGKSSRAASPTPSEHAATPAAPAESPARTKSPVPAAAVDLTRNLSDDAAVVRVHMRSSPDDNFNKKSNVFFGMNAEGIQVNESKERIAVNPSKWFETYNKPTTFFGYFFSLNTIVTKQLNPTELAKSEFINKTDIRELTTENINLINVAIKSTNTTKTERKLEKPIRDLLKLAAFTAAGIGIYAYFTKE